MEALCIFEIHYVGYMSLRFVRNLCTPLEQFAGPDPNCHHPLKVVLSTTTVKQTQLESSARKKIPFANVTSKHHDKTFIKKAPLCTNFTSQHAQRHSKITALEPKTLASRLMLMIEATQSISCPHSTLSLVKRRALELGDLGEPIKQEDIISMKIKYNFPEVTGDYFKIFLHWKYYGADKLSPTSNLGLPHDARSVALRGKPLAPRSFDMPSCSFFVN